MGKVEEDGPKKMDINSRAEGRAEVCHVPPSEMPPQLCTGAVRRCRVYLHLSITDLSLVVYK